MSLYLASIGIFSSAQADLSDHEADTSAHGANGDILGKTDGDGYYAPIANGVSNGDSHDHGPTGGGGTIDHGFLSNKGSNTHAQIDTAITNSTNHIAATSAHGASGNILGQTDADALYAPIAKGVTNGDSHDHSGGDGGTIDHTDLDNIGIATHAQIDSHIALSQAHGADGAILGQNDADALYAPIANGVTNGDSHDHSGGDGAQIDHTTLSNKGSKTHTEIDAHLNSDYSTEERHVRKRQSNITSPPTKAQLTSLCVVADKLYIIRNTNDDNHYLCFMYDYNGGKYYYIQATEQTT